MQKFKHISDEEWLNLLVNPVDGVPRLPPEDVQTRFCGRSGKLAMEQAIEFYKVVREASKKAGRPLESMDAILEFGCGWGRITRCFLKEVPTGVLSGCDCIPEMVKLCGESFPGYRFVRNDPMPPTPFQAGSFDLVYAYSVFSHLSEKAHIHWLKEFHRIMKPGGVLVLTTRPRYFINYWPTLTYVREKVDVNKVLENYDSGNFVHVSTGGGGDTLDESFYGETAIPESYIRREWSPWFNIDMFLEDVPYVDQKIIIARRV